ncbi:MAG: phage holin family protein [Oscillospiraceae bacterium]|nr:phage holin family protein [Oscillospiraceae bacterium]
MDNKWFAVKGALGVVVTVLASLLGGFDIWLITLIGFSVADYVTGLLKGFINKNLHSEAAFRGGLKKAMIYVIVGLAAALDGLMLPEAPILRGLAVGYYIATEGLSILENISACGVPFPQKLKDVLLALRDDKAGNTGGDADGENGPAD